MRLNCLNWTAPLLLLQVGFLNSGKVVALDVSYYSNAGNSLDLSLSVSIVTDDRLLFCFPIFVDDVLMLSPVCICEDHGARPVPHGKLVQYSKHTWSWLHVPHQPAVQHSL